ncbi:ATP-grasp fold amidoligase family protein [Brevibacterium yomogidense]|uniref:ATP-grasp fold amidoligase family protein n=1 Tax=Brevibacterium yomogidense TaxID=946573 RepID=UPI000B35687D|nr:ATP-grasp fold amidoligase family protein [Brevibacterium yomogidense]
MVAEKGSGNRSQSLESLRDRVGELRERSSQISDELRLLVDSLRVKSMRSDDPEALALYLEALDLTGVDDLTHQDLVAVARHHRLKMIPHSDSFWRSIVVRRRKKQLGRVPEKRLGLNKQKDERFATLTGVSTVDTLFRGKFSDIPRDNFPSVLKPVISSGSRGAFYIFEDGIFSIAGTRPVESWSELEAVARREVGDPESTEWELQRLVTWQGRPAPDLKFYCFYGEIGTVLEVTRHPSLHYAYFDGGLKPIAFRSDVKPKFDDLSSTSVLTGGLDEAKLDIVRRYSAEIPVPFMRIDFLNSDRDLVFCEFSSAPGLSHSLHPEHDARLGEMYHRAEMRLTDDLLAGKRFDAFMKYTGRTREE